MAATTAATAQRQAAAPAGGDLVYVYAIIEAASPAVAALAEAPPAGLEGAAVAVVVEGSLAAVYSRLPAATYDEGPFNEHLRDLAWLAPRAAAHQEVNARLLALGEALLPLSFGAIFRDLAPVRQLLRAQRADFQARLDYVRGRAEWVASLAHDPAQVAAAVERESEPVRAALAELAHSSPGRAYLLRRRLDDVRRQEIVRLDGRACSETMERLEALAVEIVREPAAPADDRAGAMVVRLRASLLLPREREQALLAAAEELRQRWQPLGYTLQLTGPWPPYRFAGQPPAAGDEPDGAPARSRSRARGEQRRAPG